MSLVRRWTFVKYFVHAFCICYGSLTCLFVHYMIVFVVLGFSRFCPVSNDTMDCFANYLPTVVASSTKTTPPLEQNLTLEHKSIFKQLNNEQIIYFSSDINYHKRKRVNNNEQSLLQATLLLLTILFPTTRNHSTIGLIPTMFSNDICVLLHARQSYWLFLQKQLVSAHL